MTLTTLYCIFSALVCLSVAFPEGKQFTAKATFLKFLFSTLLGWLILPWFIGRIIFSELGNPDE